MSKAFTKNDWVYYYKYPVTSKESGNTYKVSICPYGQKSDRYSEGCVVRLYRKGKIFNHELMCQFFDNNNGKIRISYAWHKDIETDYEYNMISMSQLIVKQYENTIKNEIKTIKKIDKDFESFKEWKGEV